MTTARTIILLLMLVLITSCGSLQEAFNQNFRRVRFFVTSISNIERNKISFTNGTSWKTDRLFIGVNMSEVFVMLDETINRGWMYFKETQIGITQLEPDFFQYKEGSINFVKSFQNEGAVIELSDGSLWVVPVSQRELVSKWLVNTEIIVSDDNNYIINPEKMEFISTVRLETEIPKN